MSNLAPVPSESSTCPNCSTPLVADQRYCLSCGHPVSPVRLAFLDVLDSERQPQLPAGAVSATPVAYATAYEPAAGPPWLRRYAPLFSVLSVLILAMIAGLLVGHWVTQSKAGTGTTIVKVEGLAGAAPTAAAGASSTPGGSAATTAATNTSKGSAKREEEQEQAEAKAEEKAEEKHPAKAPPAKKLEAAAVNKLEKTTGKKHERELSKLTTQPIEVK